MAKRTTKNAHLVHGTEPQFLVEKIIRTRIYESKYWKEECCGLTDELLTERAADLTSVGGVFGPNSQPTAFLCLTLKMLQMQPHKVVVIEFIRNEDFEYARVLGALYMRLTGTARDCHKYLEPLYNDDRNIRIRNRNGDFELMRAKEFIHQLLHSERVCDIRLPRLQKRQVLEKTGPPELPVSVLGRETEGANSIEEEDMHQGQLETNPSGHHRWQSYRDRDRGSLEPLYKREPVSKKEEEPAVGKHLTAGIPRTTGVDPGYGTGIRGTTGIDPGSGGFRSVPEASWEQIPLAMLIPGSEKIGSTAPLVLSKVLIASQATDTSKSPETLKKRHRKSRLC